MAISTGMALLGGSLLGAAGSAIGGSKAAAGQEAAAQTTADTARYTADLQKEMYEQGRTDMTPYSTLGTTASPLLQYLVTGIMPEMTQSDLDLISQQNALMAPPTADGQQPVSALGAPADVMGYDEWRRSVGGDAGTYGEQDYEGYVAAQGGGATIPMSAGADGTYQAGDIDQYALANARARQQSINALQGGYQMQESPMYSWQQERGERALNRQAAAKGLSGSRASLNALSDFNRGLGAQEADKQYGRLLDLTNIGRGMAATGIGAGQTYAAGAGNALMSGASQSALYSGQAAQTKGSMYENLGQGFGQMATNYLNQPQQNAFSSPTGLPTSGYGGVTYTGGGR